MRQANTLYLHVNHFEHATDSIKIFWKFFPGKQQLRKEFVIMNFTILTAFKSFRLLNAHSFALHTIQMEIK